MNITQSIIDFQCSGRNCVYFKEKKFSFASEQNTKATLTKDFATIF